MSLGSSDIDLVVAYIAQFQKVWKQPLDPLRNMTHHEVWFTCWLQMHSNVFMDDFL